MPYRNSASWRVVFFLQAKMSPGHYPLYSSNHSLSLFSYQDANRIHTKYDMFLVHIVIAAAAHHILVYFYDTDMCRDDMDGVRAPGREATKGSSTGGRVGLS